jgi:uncharacterized protein (TIGR03435 family)
MTKLTNRMGVLAGATCLAAAGQAGGYLSFEVASLKPSTAGAMDSRTVSGGPGTSSPGQITYTNQPLRQILMNAYGVKADQISGPGWLETERFDISAKVAAGTTNEQANVMMQNLLVDRFHLFLHCEPKEMDAYALTLGRTGAKLAPAATATSPAEAGTPTLGRAGKDGWPALPPGQPGIAATNQNGHVRLRARESPLSDFTRLMASQLGTRVVDQTGLTGKYDFELEFSTEGLVGRLGQALPPPTEAEAQDLPTIFGAVQRLGLKLQKTKAPVEILVIDRIEKVPGEN